MNGVACFVEERYKFWVAEEGWFGGCGFSEVAEEGCCWGVSLAVGFHETLSGSLVG